MMYRTMWKRGRTRIAGLLLLFLIAGCAGRAAGPDPDASRPEAGHLQQKVGLAPFVDLAGFTEPTAGFFQRSFVQAIHDACPDVVLAAPRSGMFPDNRIPRLESGWVDNRAVAEIGRREGWAAVVNAALVGADVVDQRKGFWWFKRTRYFSRVEIHVEVYDTETAAKLLDEFIVEEAEIEGLDEVPGGRLIPDRIPEIQERVVRAVNAAGRMICRAVGRQPWQTFITGVEADSLEIGAGRESGLAPGDVLEVSGPRGEPMEGGSGQVFTLPGAPIGTIQVAEVFPDTARAVVLSGSGFAPGQTVRR